MSNNTDFILIASPAQRCGTTLLQRLLSSLPEVLIFGETVANDINILASIWQSKLMMLQFGAEQRDEQLAQVLQGNVNHWIPDLLPPVEKYLQQQRQLLEAYLKQLSDYLAKQGRRRFGAKMPGWQTPQLRFILNQFPDSKLLYIVRDLDDCVASAPKIGLCTDEHATQQFRHFYQNNLGMAEQQLRTDNVHWIRYEQFISEPESHLQAIEQFLGEPGIDRTVMNYRIDNYKT